jgi:hypothetical protein
VSGSHSSYGEEEYEEEEEELVPDPVLFFPGGDADCGAAASGKEFKGTGTRDFKNLKLYRPFLFTLKGKVDNSSSLCLRW